MEEKDTLARMAGNIACGMIMNTPDYSSKSLMEMADASVKLASFILIKIEEHEKSEDGNDSQGDQ